MNNNEFTVDAKQVIAMFNEFNAKLKKKTFTTALRKAAKHIAKTNNHKFTSSCKTYKV